MESSNLTTQSSSSVKFSEQTMPKVDKLIANYPEKQAALIPLLHIAQDEFDHLSSPVIDYVAELLEITPSHVYGTAKFYDMFRFTKRAKHEVIVCRNISCDLCGSSKLIEKLSEKLGAKSGQQSANGKFFLLEAECLAACDKAPVLMLDEKLYEHVDPDNLPADLKRLLEDS